MRYLFVMLLAACISGGAALAQGAPAGDALGMWVVRDGRAKVKVDRCRAGLCGRIVWLKEPNDESGRPLTDGNNIDPAMRKRPILQLPIAYNMVPERNGYWTGAVYDPERGKSYNGSMELLPDGRLKVTGCLLFVCESNYWRRATE